MNATAEVARIKAEFAARDSVWLETVRSRIEAAGPSQSTDLAIACGILESRQRHSFWTFLAKCHSNGWLVKVGTALGPTGCLNTTWGLP